MNKTIVVLANSRKRGGRCLAGKEVLQKGNSWEIGSWIRPVATENSGEVSEYFMRTALGHVPRLLEIVEISLMKSVPLPDQPENWLLEIPVKPKSWRSHGLFAWKEINALLDRPLELWNDGAGPRRVNAGYPQSMAMPASLYLIKPDGIQSIKIWSEPNPFEPMKPVKRHRQIILHYAGISHELDIDDVDFAERYYPNFPSVDAPPIYPKLRNPAETLLCVSLTPEFHGHHYKIAAAFFEPPE